MLPSGNRRQQGKPLKEFGRILGRVVQFADAQLSPMIVAGCRDRHRWAFRFDLGIAGQELLPHLEARG